MNAEEEEFGTERLVELVKSNYQKKPEVLSSLIMRSVKEFDVDGQQDDDITIVIIKKE